MPIYAYKCAACGHAQDVLQKISDAPLTVCPACGASAYSKQVTAAGFQLKGSGWYVTDFRDKGTQKSDSNSASKADSKTETKSPDTATSETKSAVGTESKAESKTESSAAPAPAPAPSNSTTGTGGN